MGLPLFIAPVESDLPKASDKSRAASPNRSGIRRHARAESRERRAALRRHISNRERERERGERDFMARWRPSPLRESHLVSRTGLDVDAATAPDAPGRLRDGPRETRSEDRRHNNLEEHLSSLFRNSTWEGAAASSGLPDDQADLGWWTFETLPRYNRPRIVGPVSFQQDEDGLQSRRPPAPIQPTAARAYNAEQERRRRRADFRNRAMARVEMTERRRNATSQQNRAMDGLGDRDRSLSPEVWDTLLSTLTPDPQPPSAGSSFASTVASQSAGASTSTPLTAPDPPHDTQVDCESGCENSDTESLDYEHPDFARIRQRRNALRRVRVRVPDYNLDGPADGPIDGPFSRSSGAVNPESSATRRRRSPDGPLPAAEDAAGDTAELDGPLPHAHRRPRHGWVGQLSVGNSDDEQVLERWGLTREESTTSGNNTTIGDDDWMGMQRIVRSLARREDIPDEWWAEAGLSRNLPGDGPE